MLDASVSQRTGWRIFSCRCHTQLPANRVSVCGTDCERGQPNYPLLCCASKPPACIATPAGVVCKKIIKRVSILDPEGANFFFFFLNPGQGCIDSLLPHPPTGVDLAVHVCIYNIRLGMLLSLFLKFR